MALALALPSTSVVAGDPGPNVAADPLASATALFSSFSILEAESRDALAAGVPQGLLVDLLTRAHEVGYPPQALSLCLARLAGVSRRDLPVDRLAGRYLQGMAKGVPAERIEAAAAKFQAQIEEAALLVDAAYPDRGPMSGDARRVAVDRATSAIQGGADEAALRESLLLASSSDEPVEAAHATLFTLGVLVSSGIEADRSVSLIQNAWDNGFRGMDLERLGKTVGSFSQSGEGPPEEVLDQVLHLLETGSSRDMIFDGLDKIDQGFREGLLPPGLDPTVDPSRRRQDPRRPDTRDEPGTMNDADQGDGG